MLNRFNAKALARVRFKTREVWSLAEAREAWPVWSVDNPTGLLSTISSSRLAPSRGCGEARAPVFSASLELAREGKIEIRQERTFAPLWLRPTGQHRAGERAA